jgi:outer membrane lipoprotein carrier protein
MRFTDKSRAGHMPLIVVVLLAGHLAVAEPDAADDGQKLVDEFLVDMTTMRSRFKQSLVDADGDIVEVSEGTLEIQRPGQFRWSYTEPYEQALVADGLNLWSYDVDLAQVTVKPQGDALSNTPAVLLGGSADAMTQFNYDSSFVENETTYVKLSPRNTDSGFKQVELGFKDRVLYLMVFYDNLEQTTLIQLYDVEVNEPIDPLQFQFLIPEDVDVVGTPATAQLVVE